MVPRALAGHLASGAPAAAGGVIDFGGPQCRLARAALAAHDQRAPVAQHGGGVVAAGHGQIGHGGEGIVHRVVGHGAAQRGTRSTGAARHEDGAIAQQRARMPRAGLGQ